MVNGRADEIVPACMASVPLIQSNTAAIAPSAEAQKMRWGTGASSLPPAMMLSITREPESDEVIKKTSIKYYSNNRK